MNASIGDGMAALGLAGGIFDYLYLKYRIRQRQIDILHHERMAAMEKGNHLAGAHARGTPARSDRCADPGNGSPKSGPAANNSRNRSPDPANQA